MVLTPHGYGRALHWASRYSGIPTSELEKSRCREATHVRHIVWAALEQGGASQVSIARAARRDPSTVGTGAAKGRPHITNAWARGIVLAAEARDVNHEVLSVALNQIEKELENLLTFTRSVIGDNEAARDAAKE